MSGVGCKPRSTAGTSVPAGVAFVLGEGYPGEAKGEGE